MGLALMKVSTDELWSFIYFWMLTAIFVLPWDNNVDHVNTGKANLYLGGNSNLTNYIFLLNSDSFITTKWNDLSVIHLTVFHAHTYTWPLLMCWLCLLVVHSLIEMGVWVLSDCKSACQLAFSAFFPISIKHPHHLLWAHSFPLCFSPEPCSTDRWCVPSTNHFSSHIEGCLTLCFWAHFHFGSWEWGLEDWMVEWEFEHWHWGEIIQQI